VSSDGQDDSTSQNLPRDTGGWHVNARTGWPNVGTPEYEVKDVTVTFDNRARFPSASQLAYTLVVA
jgi:hypothetical protein